MSTGISIGGSPVEIGERVVYPNGGICKVKGVQKMRIANQDLLMLMLQREEDDATVMVPEGKVGSIGLRKVATGDAIKVLFEFFTHSSADPELDWKVRHRENFEKMAAGGLLDTAQVLKGLHALAQLRPLPTKEREMYDSARHQLVGEISASLNIPPAVAENNIDYALTPPPGSGRTAPKDAPLDIKMLRRSMGGARRVGTGTDDDLDLGEEEADPLLAGLPPVDDEEGEEGAEPAAKKAGGDEEDEDEEAPKPKKAPAKPKAAAKAAKAPAPKAAAPAAVAAAPEPLAKPAAAKAAPPAAAVKSPEPAPAPKPVAVKPEAPKAPPPAAPVKSPEPAPKAVAAKPVAAKPVAAKPVAAKPAPKPPVHVEPDDEEMEAPKAKAPAKKPAAAPKPEKAARPAAKAKAAPSKATKPAAKTAAKPAAKAAPAKAPAKAAAKPKGAKK